MNFLHSMSVLRIGTALWISSCVALLALVPAVSATESGSVPANDYVEGEAVIFFAPKAAREIVGESDYNRANALTTDREAVLQQAVTERIAARHKDVRIELESLDFRPVIDEIRPDRFEREDSAPMFMGVATAPGRDTADLIRELERDPDIAFVQPNYHYLPDQSPVIDQENAISQWNLFNNSQNAGIRADQVWQTGVTGKGVTVAIIDTGVELTHPDLNGQLWQNPGESACADGIDNDANGFVDDCHGWDFGNSDNDPSPDMPHGTHISGIVAAARNQTGSMGVAHGARIMPIRVFDTEGKSTTAKIASAIEYATRNGAEVINMSLGGARTTCPTVEATVIEKAYAAGVFMVSSSGNGGAGSAQAPAICQYVFAVGATDDQKQIPDFSGSYQNVVEGVAPGVNILSTSMGNFSTMSGTSTAAPHVSGIAALLLEKRPDLKPLEIANLLCASAEDLGDPGRDERSGCGFISAARAFEGIGGPPPPTTACHLIDGPDSMPSTTEFAPPYNLFSSAKELWMQVDCAARQAIFGNGNPSLHILRNGYYKTPLGKWQKVNFTGEQTNTAAWFTGNARFALPEVAPADTAKPHYLLAYFCTRGEGRWQCGCRDEACLRPYWSLQIFTPQGA